MLPEALGCRLESALKAFGFHYSRSLLKGVLFIRQDGVWLAIDHRICEPQAAFEYHRYTDEQNFLMHETRALFRGVVDRLTDIDLLLEWLTPAIQEEPSDEHPFRHRGSDRQRSHPDPTPPEFLFEKAFMDVYGRESLQFLAREYPVLDFRGQTRFVDYYLERKFGNVAIEKNGVTYHHPQIIGRQRYDDQLLKQNSLVAEGVKVYRWALEGMKFKEKFEEELRLYLGDRSAFVPGRQVSLSRRFRLYPHQDNALETLQMSRTLGENASLLVLPTGTGKTEVLVADYARFQQSNLEHKKALVLVPSRHLKDQLTKVFRSRLPEHDVNSLIVGDRAGSDVLIQTYAWMIKNLSQFRPDDFDYIAVDEAHHSVAPALKNVIQKFRPTFLLGLTATDQRLDAKKLEDVFGQYEVDLSLVEAIEQSLLSPIRAFRLKSSLDLSQVRFNGHDFVNSDLEKTVLVPSRNELIIDLLQRYFVDSTLPPKSGLIFCVNVRHAENLASAMKARGLSCESVSGRDARSSKKIRDYQEGRIQFLTSCSLLNEGWDSPRTSVLVMARPTMSRVLYTQQLGRGTRKFPGKEALYVIDVVDNYGPMGSLKNTPWSLHAILGCSKYKPWGDPLRPESKELAEEVILAGLYESERALEEIDILTFEAKYPEHLSEEQLARELFVSTGTVKNWVKSAKLTPSVTIPFGRSQLHYFAPDRLREIRETLGLKERTEATQYEDFFEFLEERNYSMSYKMVMVLALIESADSSGECDLDDLTQLYSHFYRQRVARKQAVDRPGCPYSADNLEDAAFIKK